MSNPAPLIDYALNDIELPADRLLRRIVGFAAIVYGGEALVGMALHIALAKRWAASPSGMAWDLEGGWHAIVMAADVLATCAMILAGVLLLKRARVSIPVLRASITCMLVLTVLSLAMLLHESSVYASYWSRPATAVVEAMGFFRGIWLPVLLLLLTLPPLARRMV